MSNPPVISDAFSRTSSAATANFLSSFGFSLGAGGSLSKLFENLLSNTQTMPLPPMTRATSAAKTANYASPSDGGSFASAPSATPSGTMGDVVSALHDFAAKWNGFQNGAGSRSSSGNAPTVTTTSSATPSSTDNAQTNAANTASGAAASPADGSANSASGAASASDPNAPPSLADLLAQLQAILHMLQKQMQAAQAATTNDANGGGDQPLQDLLAAGGALGDLLALAQMMEKKFGLAQNGGASPTANAANAADPNLATLDTQLRANLKILMDSLKAAANANADPTSGDTVAADANGATVSTLLTPQSADLAATPATPDDLIKGALATADDFLKQLNNLYGATAPASAQATAVAADAVAAAGGKDGAFLSSDQDGDAANSTANTANTGAQGAETLSATAEGPKSSSPYSFASQLSAMRAQNGGTVGLPSAVEQVLLQLNRNASNGNDQMRIQLHPADLGSIDIKLDFAKNGTVSGTVIASNVDTLNMLQKDSRSLERALQEAGLRADPGSLQFSLGEQSNGNSGQNAQNQSSGGSTSDPLASGGVAVPAAESNDDSSTSWVITPGRVNITV